MILEYIMFILVFIGLSIISVIMILLIMAECHLDTEVRKEMKKYYKIKKG